MENNYEQFHKKCRQKHNENTVMKTACKNK